MARNKRNTTRRQHREGGYNKMRARTERMNAGVRLALCGLLLTASCAFLVAGLPHHRKLEKLRADLAEVQASEQAVIDQKDAKERELRAIEKDPAYLELIARDRLNYYKPGETIFRIERE
ncbi:septum formation initiator family protein [Verrucomicrobiaceae bacterium R5-34]|uniref:Septum formation initiator family protein n=1 Tax=Oceaniferula flava TaxID=2800421 RepID=A0AAE2SAW3_9BACT|nr:septum formation initiator family protein [Oceaniferula flavus]MBK1829272.1 septum formation initiator family protein [Verrucomicrobiaceae bacterium R5-34]MBK1853509.1 septum formation initiator family protein [Oceaniferula flavus]MBM1134814.1 septum formation initiator family protein [Oceaniferula flavus]